MPDLSPGTSVMLNLAYLGSLGSYDPYKGVQGYALDDSSRVGTRSSTGMFYVTQIGLVVATTIVHLKDKDMRSYHTRKWCCIFTNDQLSWYPQDWIRPV